MIEVDFYAKSERLNGTRVLECLNKFRRVGPELLIAERLVPENVPTLFLQLSACSALGCSAASSPGDQH